MADRSAGRALANRASAHADAVDRLVEASFALIAESGNLEPRVGEIVARAGLSNQAFYRHFRSKDELLLTVLDEGVRQLCDYLEHRMQSVPDATGRVRAWVGGVLEQALHPDAAVATRPFALSRARLSELFPDEVEASERRLTALLRDAIAAARDRPDPEAAEADADVVYNLAMGWVQRKLARRTAAGRGEASHLIEFALRGLRL